MPQVLKSDVGIARASIRGAARVASNVLFPWLNRDDREPYTTREDFHRRYQREREVEDKNGELLSELLKQQPEALSKESQAFQTCLKGIIDVCWYGDELIDECLNQSRADPSVYQQLAEILILDKHLYPIITPQTYSRLKEACLKTNDDIIRKVIFETPCKAMIRAIPKEALQEEHLIMGIIGLHKQGLELYDPDVEFESTDIPATFTRSRQLYEHLSSLPVQEQAGSGFDFEFSFPSSEWSEDPNLCLACMPSGPYEKGILEGIWAAISEKLKAEENFVQKAVARNVDILRYCCTPNDPACTFNVLLTAFATHGYDRVQDALLKFPGSATAFERSLKAKLDSVTCLQVVLAGVSFATDGCPLHVLRMDQETRIHLWQQVADYADIPHGKRLQTLTGVWELHQKMN